MLQENYPDLFADELLKRSEGLRVPGSDPITFDSHQEEAMLAVAIAVSDGERKFSVVHPGGSGKTVLEAGIVQASQAAKKKLGEAAEGTKDLVLTVERSLITNVREHLEATLGEEVGQWGMGERNLDPKVIVASVQALQRQGESLRDHLNLSRVSLVLGDEADKYLTKSRIALLNKFRGAYRIGLTATDEWSDGRHIDMAWGQTLHKLRLMEGIRRGINVPPLFYMYEADVDGDSINVSGGDYDHSSLASAMKSVEIEMAIPEIYKTMVPTNRRKDFPTMVFVPSVNTLHATTERLQKEFDGTGLNISSWYGGTPNEQVINDTAAFDRGELDMLVLCEMGGRGLNLPRARCLIDAYPTLSKNKLEQRHSRVLRRIREGSPLEKEGFQKGFANIAQILPRSNSFRPVTLLDILDQWANYQPGQMIGRGGGKGNPDLAPPYAAEVAEIVQHIKAHPVRSRVSLIEHVDILKEIQSFEDIPQADEDGFIYLDKE